MTITDDKGNTYQVSVVELRGKKELYINGAPEQEYPDAIRGRAWERVGKI